MSARCGASTNGEEAGTGYCTTTLSGRCIYTTNICCRACNVPVCSSHYTRVECKVSTCSGFDRNYVVCKNCWYNYVLVDKMVGNDCYCHTKPEYVTVNVPLRLATN